MPSDLSSGERVREVLARYVDRRAMGQPVSLDELCCEHPSLAEELRELVPLAESLLERLSPSLGGSFSEQLRQRFGRGVDPQVELEAEGGVRSDLKASPATTELSTSSEVLERLAGRGPASTRYRVKDEIGRGGMGAVLRVWDEDLRRHLAMKVMLGKGLPRSTGHTPHTDPRVVARFLEEAQVTSQLDHPGIVPVHELGLDAEGRVYFTMKLVRGKTLKEVLDELASGQGNWTQTRVLGLLLRVCEAMSYAHAKGVIHRDLKPANIMVGRYGEVFVMDWGLARILGREDDRDIRLRPEAGLATSAVQSERHDRAAETPDMSLVTMDGDVVGTPAYMPPEQAAGDLHAMGPHSDVYALGAMLYHLLVGHKPYVPPGLQVNNYAIWR